MKKQQKASRYALEDAILEAMDDGLIEDDDIVNRVISSFSPSVSREDIIEALDRICNILTEEDL